MICAQLIVKGAEEPPIVPPESPLLKSIIEGGSYLLLLKIINNLL